MSSFVFQTVQVDGQIPFEDKPLTRGDGLAAGIKLAHKALVALNEFGVSRKINREIETRSAEIMRHMPTGGGVLLWVGTMEWATPDLAGTRAQMYLSLTLIGGGRDPLTLLRRFLNEPHIVQGAPHGWRRRDSFVWVTLSRA